MIMSTELRLMPGDWVTVKGEPRCAMGVIINPHHSVDALVYFQNETVNIGDVKPIPITPEILEKWFGFVYRFGEWQSYDIEGGFDTCHVGGWEYVFSGDTVCTFKYVHQLQHLYEALTGTKLERIDL